MKILHTADWHLGKVLHGTDLEEDHRLFFNWLLDTIQEEGIDVLLVSGDVFDHNNPGNEARTMYYQILSKLAALNVRVIITGGNHDSVHMLQASSEVLSLLGITVVGGVPEKIEELFIELKDGSDQIVAVCIAVPFIRERDLRTFVSGESSEDRIKSIKDGIVAYYHNCKVYADNKYQHKYPLLAMGHLYMQGASLSEAERDIQVGNAAGIEARSLEGLFDYFALGHIHVSLRYGSQIRYSGSPIALSFSEKEDEKKVILVEVRDKNITSKSLTVPQSRSLTKISGPWDEITLKLKHLPNDKILPPLIELEIHEEISKIAAIEQEISSFKNEGLLILKRKFVSRQQLQLSNLTEGKKSINDVKPIEVFEKKLEADGYSEDEKQMLKTAYQQLVDEYYNT